MAAVDVYLWLEMTILSAIIYAFISLLDKVVSDTVLPTLRAAMALIELPRFLTFMIIGAVGCNRYLGAVDDRFTWQLIAWGGIACRALYAVAMLVWNRGIANTDISPFVPLFATRTIFTTALAFLFLGGSFPIEVYLAIGLIEAFGFAGPGRRRPSLGLSRGDSGLTELDPPSDDVHQHDPRPDRDDEL